MVGVAAFAAVGSSCGSSGSDEHSAENSRILERLDDEIDNRRNHIGRRQHRIDFLANVIARHTDDTESLGATITMK